MQKKILTPLLAVCSILVVVLLCVFLFQSSDEPEPRIDPGSAAPALMAASDSDEDDSFHKRQTDLSTPAPAPSTPTPESPDAPDPDETPWMDPEEQPRKWFALDMDRLNELPDGYVLDGAEFVPGGVTLPPPAPGEENKPRTGTVLSPPIPLDFPSNAVAPMWREDVTEGSSVFVEVCMSPDGDNWGVWNPVFIDEDAGTPAEYYPDGSPNPNFGYEPGGVLTWGQTQYNYTRFRVTLYSEDESAPLLSGVRIHYQDSTMGQGHVAVVTTEGDGE